jgi:glutamate-5-semialdehyde dehydrogenase
MADERSIETMIHNLCRAARKASRDLAELQPDAKEHALWKMAAKIRDRRAEIQEANQRDLEAGRKRDLSDAMLDRLELTDSRVESMASGLEEIAAMPDPIGEVVSQTRRPGGLEVGRVRIPLGVVAIIYESRPNVTADAAGLCFKAGNATILRGGSEALHSNLEIAHAVREALSDFRINPDAVQVIETPSRDAVGCLLRQSEMIDVVIPRGGKSLIQRVVEESTVPVIKHYEGICHLYIHAEADLEMALRIAVNAKAQRPGTCNAMETLLVDRSVAEAFLPRLEAEFERLGIRVYGCSETAGLMTVAGPASEENYRTEYLALTCNVRVVSGLDEAVEHIEMFGSNHTESIVTRSYACARKFVRMVDSSSVMVNASTRLADGGVYGLGAEIGISTDKLHAYGPMGVRELTACKFVVLGDGHLRE